MSYIVYCTISYVSEMVRVEIIEIVSFILITQSNTFCFYVNFNSPNYITKPFINNESPLLSYLSDKVEHGDDADMGDDFYTRYKVRHCYNVFTGFIK